MRILPVILLALLACSPPPPPEPDIREVLQGEARPTVPERAEVLRLTYQYLSNLEGRRYAAAYDAHSDDYRENLAFAAWKKLVAGDWAALSQPVEIRWRQGLHRWEGPELYAIVHLDGPGRGRSLLIWRQAPDGGFLLESVER